MENERFQDLVLDHLVKLTQDITELKQDNARIKESVISIENNHGEKLEALFDASEVQIDVNECICDILNRIETKVDRLTLKISAHDVLLKKVN